MAYRTDKYEYSREEDRDNKQGGWRSWFGLGDNKDRDEGYNYTNTTTYRTPQPSYGYSSAPHPERSGTFGPYTRGGYGYSTSDEVTRGPSWNTDRDYNTRSGYGTTGDRDVYYKQETRTYGGDNWTPSRPYGETTSRDYPTSRWSDHPTSSRPSYGFSGDRSPSRGYPTTGPSYGGYSSEYTRPQYPVTGDREWGTTSKYPTSDYPTTKYPTSEYPTSRGYGFSGEHPTTRGGYSTGFDRDYPTSRSYGYPSGGYGGDRDYKSGSYSYRY